MNGWIAMMEQTAGMIERDLFGSELDLGRRDTRRYVPPTRAAGGTRLVTRLRTGIARSLMKAATWIEPRTIERSRMAGKVAR